MNKISPWDISLETRKSELLSAKKSGKKIALLLYPDENKSSSFRYRGYNIYEATKASKTWQLIYFFTPELDEVFKLIKNIDLLIFGRITKWTPKLDELAILARENDAKVLQDLDDCICGTYYIKDAFNLISPDFADQEYWINTCANYELISYLCDGFIVTNDYLGKKLSVVHDKKPYRVIKNFLNNEQIDFSKTILAQKSNITTDNFTLGYFSGSHTHASDFEVAYPELIDFLDTHTNARLNIVGLLPLPASAEKYLKRGQIKLLPLVDFLTLQKLMSEVDVNLAPLDDNIFANCKSELKFYESALVKTPTITTPTFAFKNAIKNSKTGFLCRPGEWYDVLEELYNDKNLRKQIADSAHDYVLKTYTPEVCLAEIEETYDYFTK